MTPKNLFLSAFFLFASALCLRAQENYEYASITYAATNTIGISLGGKYTETKVQSEFNGKISLGDLTPLLNQVNELAKQGWEVYSTSVIGLSVTYHLCRKKP